MLLKLRFCLISDMGNFYNKIFKESDRSGTPAMLLPPSDSKKDHPYRKNNPLKGEGSNLTDFGEQDYVGGGNTHMPATLQKGVSVDSRIGNEYIGVKPSIPTSTTNLDDLEDSITPQGFEKRPQISTDVYNKFYSEDSPILPVNHNDKKNFESLLNKLNFSRNSSDKTNGGLFDKIVNRQRIRL